MSIKVGDKVRVLNRGIFGHLVEKGDVGIVTNSDDYEIVIVFKVNNFELDQYVGLDDWQEYIVVIEE